MNARSSPRRWPFVAVFALLILLVESGYFFWSRRQHPLERVAGHSGHGAVGLTLQHGERWETDAPLRSGMQRIRDAVALSLDEAHATTTAPAAAKTLDATVQENVAYLIQNCRLPPAADADLHVILSELLAGADLLAADARSVEGKARLTHALQAYATHFDHPNWRSLPEAH
ncbi:carbonic anhydrase [Horticoccus luteus]|uniref:Carbonic anhydrase n=1 Tax=Horticoccus luteus TaxID=2862869 RepID=A0A8F9TVI4_9BACT|nr:carbonic anhydrase [Horticoccus luteus]QYM78890.1 carbonic anhydrase [Horticoccus luteus]